MYHALQKTRKLTPPTAFSDCKHSIYKLAKRNDLYGSLRVCLCGYWVDSTP